MERGLPDAVRTMALRRGARAWVDGLASFVADLEREWAITVGRSYGGATEAFVAEAVTDGGEPVVLKLLVPREDAEPANEVTVLRLAGGSGCVRLLRHDTARGALLLDRLGPSLADLRMPFAQRIDVLVGVAQALWRPVSDSGLPTGADKAARLGAQAVTCWTELGRPCSERAIEHAVACAERRAAAHDDERAVLVHGDVHRWNTLATRDRSGYALVDPDGYAAEPECELGVLMREDVAELMAGDPWDRARLLAARTGTDATAIWEWGVLERVVNGLLCLLDGLTEHGVASLAAADRIAGP